MVTENIYLHSNIFNFIRSDIRCPDQRGVAIAIKKSFRYDLLDITYLGHHSIELIGIKLFSQGLSFVIINIYRHLSSRTPPTVIEGLLDYVANQSHAVLLGDFNLHNVAWGCSITDSLGRSFKLP